MLEYKISVFQKLFLQILHDAPTQKHVLLKKEVYNRLYKFPPKNVTELLNHQFFGRKIVSSPFVKIIS